MNEGDRLLQEHLRLARYALMTGDQPLARASIDAALALGAQQDPRQAEDLRRMRKASLALEGKGGQNVEPSDSPATDNAPGAIASPGSDNSPGADISAAQPLPPAPAP